MEVSTRGEHSSPRTINKGAISLDPSTPMAEGDLLRDQALDAIRRGHLNQADKLLAQACYLHLEDANRQAVLRMVKARILYARKDYKAAVTLHTKAQAMWDEIGDAADPQWIRNNRFHWLLATVRAKDPSAAHRLGGDILRDESIERRRRLVHQIDQHYLLAVIAYDLMERLYWRFGGLLKRSNGR